MGKDPINNELVIEHIFIRKNGKDNIRKFDRELIRVRKLCKDEVASMIGLDSSFYINSLNPYTITYKGQLILAQVS